MAKSRRGGERQPVHVGLEMSKNETQVCVVAADGAKPFEATVATDPGALLRAIAKTAVRHEARVGLIGLERRHGRLVRARVEGLGLARRPH